MAIARGGRLMAVLDVAGLSFNDVVRVLEKATDNIILCMDEVLENQHMLAHSRMTSRDLLATQERLVAIKEVQALMKEAKEKLRKM
jgi:hypothetical protein